MVLFSDLPLFFQAGFFCDLAGMALQGGRIDLPDRLFHSLHNSYQVEHALALIIVVSSGDDPFVYLVATQHAATSPSLSDVRELIPEFYYLPECLTNVNRVRFGRRKCDGEVFFRFI